MCQKIELPYIGIPLFAYGFMILLGFLAAIFLAQREASRHGISRERIMDFGVFMVLAGVVGARLFYIVQFYDEHFRGKPWYEYFAIWQGGMVFYGGAILAVVTGAVYLRWHRLPTLTLLDTCAPFVPIGMAFGRIGCYLNGCCWGWRCDSYLPAAVNEFPAGSPVHAYQSGCGLIEAGGQALAVHPTQLYDATHSFLLFGLLWWYLRQTPARGAVSCVFAVAYGLGRFVVEMLRGDHRHTFSELTVSQCLSLLMVVVGIAGLVVIAWRARKAPMNTGTEASSETVPAAK